MKITFRVKNAEGTEILVDDTMTQDQLERIAEKTVGLTMLVDGNAAYSSEEFTFSEAQVSELVSTIGAVNFDFGARIAPLELFEEEDLGLMFANAMKEAVPELISFHLMHASDEDEDEEDHLDDEPMTLLCGNLLPGGMHILNHKGVWTRHAWYMRDEILCLRPWFDEIPIHQNPFLKKVEMAPKELKAVADMHAFAVRFACALQIRALRNEISAPSPR